jgi:hypothetical protein
MLTDSTVPYAIRPFYTRTFDNRLFTILLILPVVLYSIDRQYYLILVTTAPGTVQRATKACTTGSTIIHAININLA